MLKAQGRNLAASARVFGYRPRTIQQAAQPSQWNSLSDEKADNLAGLWGIKKEKSRVFYEI